MASLDQLAKKLKDTQEFRNKVEDHLSENFLIEGKTMSAWKKYFYIDIPDNLDFHAIIGIAADIWSKYQRAAHYRDSQQVQLAIMEQTKADKYNTEYNTIRSQTQQETGKPLAADSCKIHATLAVKDLDNAISNQKVVHTFWVKTCDTLTELRKLLEIIGYAVGADIRVQKEFNIKGY